jgi:hypothetical protein
LFFGIFAIALREQCDSVGAEGWSKCRWIDIHIYREREKERERGGERDREVEGRDPWWKEGE